MQSGSNHLIRREVKPQMKLLIISIFLLFSYNSISQNINKPDTLQFKKDFEQLLKKYGFINKGYAINVSSINQKGGQTAFIITNNYMGDTTQRHLKESDLNYVLLQIQKVNDQNLKFDKNKIEIWSLPLPESRRFAIELKNKLEKIGYIITTHFNLVGAKELKENFDIMSGRENCVVIIVQPLTEE